MLHPSLDIVTANNCDIERCRGFLESMGKQTVLPERLVVLLYPGSVTQEQVDIRGTEARDILGEDVLQHMSVDIYRHGNSDFEPGRGYGADRQWRLEQATSEWVYLIDDDNTFEIDFIERSIGVVRESHDTIFSPTVRYADTKEVQSQGIVGMSRWRPQYRFGWIEQGSGVHEVMMMGGNSLLGRRETFLEYGFDPAYVSSYEDVEMTRRMTLDGVRLVVSADVDIYHHERRGDALGRRFLGSDDRAYWRARSRIRFARTVTTWWQRVQYVCVGVRIQTAGFIVLCIWYLRGDEMRGRVWSVVRGTWDGLYDIGL